MDRLETLLQYHHDDPDDAFTRYALAQEYLKRGETDQALRYFEALVRDHPDYVGTYYHLGRLYEELGRKETALETYQTGVRIAGDQNDFHARAELQGALLAAQGIGFDDDED